MPASLGTRLVKRSSGILYIVWTGNARGVSTGTRDRAEAESKLAGFIADGGWRGFSAKGRLTVIEALDDYRREQVETRIVDRGRQEICLDHLAAYFGDHEIAKLGAEEIAGYRAWRRAGRSGGKAPRVVQDPTIRRELATLTAAFNYAAKHKRVGRSEIPYVELPPASVPRDHWLSLQDCEVLLANAAGRARLFIMLALHTAARRRAIEKLTWFQVDLKARTINYAPAGHRQTKKRRPIVPISDALYPVLKAAWETGRGLGGDSYVLGSPGSIRTAFKTAIAKAAAAMEAAGHPDRAQNLRRTLPHTLRHTWATLAAQHGVPLWEIAGVLGDTIQTVTKNYAHHSPDHLRGAVNFRAPQAPAKSEESERAN